MERVSLLRLIAPIVLVFGIVWGGTLLRWSASNRVPSGVDITVWLLVVPLGVLLGYAGLRKLAKARQHRAQQTAQEEAPPPLASPTADPQLAYSLPLLAGSVRFAAGDTPAALIAAAQSQRRVGLHPRLKDVRGLPVFAAEVADVDIDALASSLDDADVFDEAQKRALWLAESVLFPLLADYLEELAPPPRSTVDVQAPILRIEWLLPARWSEAARQTAAAWLRRRLDAEGWPAARFTIGVQAVAAGHEVLGHLDALNIAFNEKAQTLPCLLLACDSHIDQTDLMQLESGQGLFSAQRPEGRLPGEGACALCLVSPQSPLAAQAAGIHRWVTTRLPRPVDAPGRAQTATLSTLLQQAMRDGIPNPAFIMADTDLRASRSSEALQFANAALPEADPLQALLPLGQANGDAGLALTLATVATAASLALETGAPGLVLSHGDASIRAMALVTPPAPPAPAAASTPTLA